VSGIFLELKEQAMSLKDQLDAAKAEVARIEAEMESLPEVIKNKTEEELSDIFHAIRHYFGGQDPAPIPTADPVTKIESPEPGAQ
jgi:predicted  nucleic acid-binding Zn-ribbon protein